KILPQFASAPYIAVFTREEPTTDFAILIASVEEWALSTITSINFVAPSPSLAIILAKSSETCCNNSMKIGQSSLCGVSGALLAQPFAMTITVSFVDVSPSTVTQLNVLFTVSFKACCKYVASMLRSVVINESIVAIFGLIIPEPLQEPANVIVWPFIVAV